MAELRNIFRAPNGDEFHCDITWGGGMRLLGLFPKFCWRDEMVELMVLGWAVPVSPANMQCSIEGFYRVWQEK